LAILLECEGDLIWNVEHCRVRGVPETWIESLAEAHESGFERDRDVIYIDRCVAGGKAAGVRPTNQFHGIHDLKLAIEIAGQLGVDVAPLTVASRTRRQIVQAIKDVIEEG